MKREFLKNLGIEDAQIDKIMAEYGKSVEKSKADFESLKSEKEKIAEQISNANKTIEKLKKNGGDIEKIQKTADEYKTKFEETQNEMKNFKRDTTLTSFLKEHGAKNTDILKPMFKDIEFSTDDMHNLEDKIKLMKGDEKTSFLFQETKKEETKETIVNTGGDHKEDKVSSVEAQFREAMGLPALGESESK